MAADGARRNSGGIYLRRGGELVALTETPYESEDLLQTLLADHPGLLAGDELGDSPRRWVLLSREIGIADQEGAAGRWSLDHLFVDQDGIPTLVEVKRSSDTRIRREVVGQLLEYAANGPRYWPVEQLRALFESGCANRGKEPDEELRKILGAEADVDAWWDLVGTNLRSGRLRLVFVADVINRELRRIIEFLNEQMTQTEVIGVEIRQYVDASGEHQTLVPRLIGQTEAARDLKDTRPTPPKRSWDQASWLSEFEQNQDASELEAVQKLLEWASRQGLSLRYGSGATVAMMRFGISDDKLDIWPFSLWPNGSVEIEMREMVTRPWPPFDQIAKRQELRERLERIPGVSIPEGRLDKYPTFPTSALADHQSLSLFIEAMDWVFAQVREAAQVS